MYDCLFKMDSAVLKNFTLLKATFAQFTALKAQVTVFFTQFTPRNAELTTFFTQFTATFAQLTAFFTQLIANNVCSSKIQGTCTVFAIQGSHIFGQIDRR